MSRMERARVEIKPEVQRKAQPRPTGAIYVHCRGQHNGRRLDIRLCERICKDKCREYRAARDGESWDQTP